MKEDIYESLRQRFDQLPIGAPKSAKGTEIKILKELFTPKEAELAAQLKDIPETVDDVAKRLGRAKEEIKPLLESMAQKGSILGFTEGGTRHYCIMVFEPGMFDACLPNFERTEKNVRVAGLINDYFNEVFIQELHRKGTSPWGRALVIEKQIPHEVGVLPFERASEILKKASTLVVYDCYCRGKRHLIGKRCEAPHEDMCILLGPFAEFFLERGLGKKVTVEEALKVLEKAEEHGLIHSTTNNIEDPQFVCNCCGCCCIMMRGITQLKDPATVVKSNFYLSIDKDNCSGCGECIERCQVKALRLEDNVAVVDASLCIGCGLCNLCCPTEALSMKRKEKITHPFETYDQLMLKIMQEKGKPLSL